MLEKRASFKGIDNQIDTYFNVNKGRLKLREGNIENNLIYYERENSAGPKKSNFNLLPVEKGSNIKDILTNCLGIKAIVNKKREIYFIENIKFHIDTLHQLGNFVEIEASNKYMPLSLHKLTEQCNYYINYFSIAEVDIINISYSDMILSL